MKGINDQTTRFRIFLIAALLIIITIFHYTTEQSQMYHHILFREAYFIPIIMGGVWFGLKGALSTSIAITCFYLPFTLISWGGFSPMDWDRIIEIFLFNVIAVVLGYLRDQERAREREKLEAVLAMAGTVGHELNTPLQVLLGNVQLLLEDLEGHSEACKELHGIMENLKEMNRIVKKISGIERFETRLYHGDDVIVDIERSYKQQRPK